MLSTSSTVRMPSPQTSATVTLPPTTPRIAVRVQNSTPSVTTRRGSTDVVEAALPRAVRFRDPATGFVVDNRDQLEESDKVIFHADRGCQYTPPRSRPPSPSRSACGSRSAGPGCTGIMPNRNLFWSTLKTEYYDRYEFTDHREAVHGVTSWIETVYNRRRRHSSLGQISPVTFEHQLNTAANRSRIADVHQTGSTPVNR